MGEGLLRGLAPVLQGLGGVQQNYVQDVQAQEKAGREKWRWEKEQEEYQRALDLIKNNKIKKAELWSAAKQLVPDEKLLNSYGMVYDGYADDEKGRIQLAADVAALQRYNNDKQYYVDNKKPIPTGFSVGNTDWFKNRVSGEKATIQAGLSVGKSAPEGFMAIAEGGEGEVAEPVKLALNAKQAGEKPMSTYQSESLGLRYASDRLDAVNSVKDAISKISAAKKQKQDIKTKMTQLTATFTSKFENNMMVDKGSNDFKTAKNTYLDELKSLEADDESVNNEIKEQNGLIKYTRETYGLPKSIEKDITTEQGLGVAKQKSKGASKFTIGKKYQSNGVVKEYLGGDPGDLNSWR